MRIEELMTRLPRTCGPDDTLSEAAREMWDHDCGCLPVTDGCRRVVGMITDRDICMAALLLGASLKDLRVGDAMTKEVRACEPKDNLVEAQAIMQEARVRRLPVVDESKQLLGVLSLADLAREAERELEARKPGITKAEIGKVLATLCDLRRGPSRVYSNLPDRRIARFDSAS